MSINLTDEQKEFVFSNTQKCYLNALAGTGKTTAVAYKLHHFQYTETLLPFQGIAAMSFTNVAKKAIENEYFLLKNIKIEKPNFIGTFDSFLNTFVFKPFGYFVMGDTNKDINILPPNYYGEFYYYGLDSNSLSKLHKYKIEPRHVVLDIYGKPVLTNGKKIPEDIVSILETYKAKMKLANTVTQSDINYYSLKILENNDHICSLIQNRFPAIIVDEVQDCSDIQWKILDKICCGHTHVCLVGDANQSIYEFRNAVPKIFVEKCINPNGWHVYSLKQSQRSGPHICNFLNNFLPVGSHLENNPERKDLLNDEVLIEYVNNKDLHGLIDKFNRKITDIGANSAAVLFYPKKSKINFANMNTCPFAKSKKNNPKVGVVSGLIMQITELMNTHDYPKALIESQRLFYYLSTSKLPVNKDDIRQSSLANLDVKTVLWSFCNSIPRMNIRLKEWIDSMNVLIDDTAHKLGIENINLYLYISQKFKKDNPYFNKFISCESIDDWPKIVFKNIHQIKGESYDAVLVYIGGGNGDINMSSINKAITTKNMCREDASEKERCFFVAASRAKKLLWITSTSSTIKKMPISNMNSCQLELI